MASLEARDFRTITEEILVSLRLGQHHKVAKLCCESARFLAINLDEEFEDNLEGADDDSFNAISSGWILIDQICHRLRELSKISVIYDDVLKFVRVYDLVSFGQLIGAPKSVHNIERKRKKQRLDWANYELLERTLRQSTMLLRELNASQRRATGTLQKKRTIIPLVNIVTQKSIGFNKYTIEVKSDEPKYDRTILDLLKDQNIKSKFVEQNLKTDWFETFVQIFLEQPYHLDRFAILISLWIIGSQSKHAQLEQLMCELCDQIFHQEANSCQLEELLQLTQIGSFWLTHKKRFQVTFKRVDFSPSLGNVLDEVNLDEDNGTDNSSVCSVSSSSSVQLDCSSTKSTTREANKTTIRSTAMRHKSVDFSLKLRRLIDEELLIGRDCLLCGREPSGQLLDPIQLGATSQCPECQIEQPSEIYCSSSFKVFQIVSLKKLEQVHKDLEHIYIITPNEWAEMALNVMNQAEMSRLSTRSSLSGRTLKNSANRQQSEINRERIDIANNFERLTVLRSEDDTSSEDDEDEDNDNQNSSNTSSSSDNASFGLADLGSDDTSTTTAITTVLEGFMKARMPNMGLNKPGKVTNDMLQYRQKIASESLQSISYFRSKGTKQVIVCAGDILCCDTLVGQYVDLRLLLTRRKGLSFSQEQSLLIDYDLIYACLSRSPTSQLMLGCGRYFSQLEMVRAIGHVQLVNIDLSNRRPIRTASVKPSDASCLFCGCQLTELRPGLNTNEIGQISQR